MRDECRSFATGNCRFGRNCKYQHITQTPILDPPTWIHSCLPGLATREVHPIEARLSVTPTFAKDWDDLFIFNYKTFVKHIDFLVKDSQLRSVSSRTVDFRNESSLDSFVSVFDKKRVIDEIKSECASFKKKEVVRNSDYRGGANISDYRGGTRSGDYRVDNRSGDYRADNRSGDYRGDNRSSDYRGGTRSIDYRGDNRSSDYRGDNRTSDYRGGGANRVDNFRRDFNSSDGYRRPADTYRRDENYGRSTINSGVDHYRRDSYSNPAYKNYSSNPNYTPRYNQNQTTSDLKKDSPGKKEDDLTKDDILIEEFVCKKDNEEFDFL